ncbi:hypothetical protein AVEN_74242-1 [Araneus ventricosus]|uniref:Uncharacterized protein n=1 Tax=Araneus ventricosus TaxID=182803 RepID=A0A4Y2ERR6_ARAVE|nr:hypothetical protein AVEN_74242-1 [Araneus ventricosus]
MNAPTLHDLEFCRWYIPEIQLPDSWEISTSKSDDIVWNVVLAYLNSFLLSDEGELSHRMHCLTGHQEVNENIKHYIEMCNPFLLCDVSFCDKEISELVAAFKERVEEYINNDETLLREAGIYFRYLEASSKLLSCNIVLIFLEDNSATLFPAENPPNPRTVYTKHISILSKSNPTRSDGRIQDQFSFCISKEICVEKKRHALREILKCVETIDNKDEMIRKVSELPDITDFFLISLLKNGLGEIIPVIYETPRVLSKLEYAGFQTDLRSKDYAGKSAFFHALKTEDSHLVYLLYDHTANACLQTDASVRSPDSVIVENLGGLKDHLQLLVDDLETSEISKKTKCLFRDLCRFNEFQVEMCKNIYNIRTEIYDETEKIYEAILIILKTYKIYFHYINVKSSVDENIISLFDEFLEHKYYFDKLDFNSAVMLFDNLFLLKKRLKLPNNAYLDLESSFCLFVFLKKFLERYKKEKHFYYASRWIAFQERLSLQRQLDNFKEILENTELSKDNIVDKFPESAVLTLTNLPQIYGEFLVSRLQHYLNAATKTKFNAATGHAVKNLKSILVIERCLQVLGECCKKSDFNSVQRILTLALSKDFTKHLKYIRDSLSHIEPHELLHRIKLESDLELFIEIKNDLVKLIKFLVPIYSAHKYEMEQFLLLHSVKYISKDQRISISEVHENQLKAILPAPGMEETQMSVPAYRCQKPWNSSFDDMNSSLEKELHDLNCNGDILRKNTAGGYKYIVQNMISAIREVLKSLEVSVSEKAIEELDSHFWCLEQILTYITTDRKLTMPRTTLKSISKYRKSLFAKLREKVYQFHEINKPTNSIAFGTPVAERDRVGKHLSSEPEDNGKQIVNSIDPFLEYGVRLEINKKWRNEFEDNGSPHEKTKSSKTNQVDTEISRENSENCILQNMLDDSMSVKTIDSKEYEEAADHLENADDPETIILTEINDLSFAEASTFHDDCLRAKGNHNRPANCGAEDPAAIKDVKRKYSIEDSATFLEKYKGIAHTIFQEFPDDSNKDFHFKYIENYCLKLEGKNILNENEKEFVLSSVPEKFRNVPKLKKKIQGLLRERVEFTEELQSELSTLKLKKQEIRDIKEEIEKYGVIDDTLCIVDSARDYFLDLTDVMKSEKLDKGEYELLCEKLELSDDAKNILFQLVPRQKGDKLEFLRNRINMLKNILIEENNTIRQLWESTTPGSKMHVKEKIIELYLKDFETQASVETLLFHCMSISRNKNLKNLWKKTTNLFSGINLRNVLAHGHPLMESLGALLDPCDLPSELVGKMLQLISDENIIDCMQQILKQSGTDLKGFLEIMQDEENGQFKTLCEQILECDHWKAYAILMNSGEMHKNLPF